MERNAEEMPGMPCTNRIIRYIVQELRKNAAVDERKVRRESEGGLKECQYAEVVTQRSSLSK